MTSRCWFASLPGERGKCSGWLVRCHLLDQQLLKREFKYGVELYEGVWRHIGRDGHKRRMHVDRANLAPFRSLSALLEDERAWVWGCGGPMGLEGHHGRFDGRNSPRLIVARTQLPAGTEELGLELGLGWWLERKYGALEERMTTTNGGT